MAAMSVTATHSASTLDWGRTHYVEAWKRQDELVAKRLTGEVCDTLVLTEHDPVFTIGLHQDAARHLLWNETQLTDKGVSVVKTNRGGDITYHGPGQIVGYPIVNLAPRQDLHAYLRFLEQVLIESVAVFGLEGTRREGKTGIWIGSRKIAAIGVAVKRWVSYHGFALHVNTHLHYFEGIVPCGIDPTDGTVTSMAHELGHEVDLDEARRVITETFWKLWPAFIAGELPL